MGTSRLALTACTVTMLAFGASTVLADKLPDTTHDGLERVKARHVDAVYWKPGASLAAYKRIALLDCFVSFRKNWKRDQNEDRRGLMNQVTDKDMDRIKSALADEFRKVFTKELQEKGGYQIVDNAAADVLVLRPAIVNLDISAPDLMSPGMNRSFTASAGEMTLYLELYDSLTSSIIGRIVDERQGMGTGAFQITNRVTNTAEADRILRSWADRLRKALDEQWQPDA